MTSSVLGTICDCCGSDRWVPCFEENGLRLGQCQDCDLLYVDKMPSLQTRMTEMEGGHFSGGQEVLDAEKQTAAETARENVFSGYVEAVSLHVTEGRWLDIGCGGGQLLRLAAQAGYEVEGIELTLARRIAAQQDGITVHDRPIEELNFDPGSFNVITLIDVFSHLTRPRETLTELRRVLGPGGVILIATGESLTAPRKQDVFSWNLGDHLFFLGAKTMERYAGNAGLKIVYSDRVWLPNEVYSKERLRIAGRSALRNLIKAAILRVPGLFQVFRSVMLKKGKDNPLYSSIFILGQDGKS